MAFDGLDLRDDLNFGLSVEPGFCFFMGGSLEVKRSLRVAISLVPRLSWEKNSNIRYVLKFINSTFIL